MKKEYITPQSICATIEEESFIAASIGYGGDQENGTAETREEFFMDDEW